MIRSYLTLLRDERPAVLFGFACAFLSSPGQTYFISVFIGSIGESLGLGAAQMGSIYLIATLGAASLLPVTGHWLDRVDLRRYSAVVMAGLAVSCGVMAAVSGPVGLFAGFLLLRLTGQGLMTHVAVTSVARYFTDHRGRALSLVALGFPLAVGTTPAIAVMMIAALGWQLSYAAVGAAVLLIALPMLIRLIWRTPRFTRPPASETTGRPPRALDGLRIVVRTRFFWCALPVLIYMPFTSTALIFHIQAIAGMRGWSNELIAAGFTVFSIGLGGGLLLAGELVDRLGARIMLSLMNVPTLVGVVALGTVDSVLALTLFFSLMGVSSGLAQTVGAAVWVEVYGVARLATIRSFAVMMAVAGTALGPAAIGFMLDSGFSLAMVSASLAAGGSAAALLAALGARR